MSFARNYLCAVNRAMVRRPEQDSGVRFANAHKKGNQANGLSEYYVIGVFWNSMVDAALIDALERLSPADQKTILAVAEYIETQRKAGGIAIAESLLAELHELRFSTSDEGLSSARLAARRFMRENQALMRLLAQ
jgi:hypothetical protein